MIIDSIIKYNYRNFSNNYAHCSVNKSSNWAGTFRLKKLNDLST